MPLFKCEECGCVENTAVGCYWGRDRKLCSECGDGKWHDIFKKRSAVGMYITKAGYLYNEPNDHSNADFRTIGKVTEI